MVLKRNGRPPLSHLSRLVRQLKESNGGDFCCVRHYTLVKDVWPELATLGPTFHLCQNLALSLAYRQTFVPKTAHDVLTKLLVLGDVSIRSLDLKVLEDEIRKVDAFKRELPLCLLLLNDAILFLEEEAKRRVAGKSKPFLEEAIPLKKNCDDNEYGEMKETDSRDKKNRE